MTELGQLDITSLQSLKETRGKILNLGLALGYDSLESARLASGFSEVVRNGSQDPPNRQNYDRP